MGKKRKYNSAPGPDFLSHLCVSSVQQPTRFTVHAPPLRPFQAPSLPFGTNLLEGWSVILGS